MHIRPTFRKFSVHLPIICHDRTASPRIFNLRSDVSSSCGSLTTLFHITMLSLPSTQTAITAVQGGSLVVSNEAPVANLDPDMIIVKNAAVSVNPVDTKVAGSYSTPGAISGCDFAGTVLAVGSAVKRSIQAGDRVCGIVMGMNPSEPAVGSFATYVGAPGDLTLTLPASVTFETGCALGTAFATAGLALFHSLDLPGTPRRPAEKRLPVLVYGGSTATGTAAIQLLRLSGLDPIATCSPRHFDLVKSYGALEAFDYRSPDCGARIRARTNNGLRYALDCITSRDSIGICYGALGRAGGKYTALDPYPEAIAQTRKVVKADWVMGPVMIGKDIAWPPPHRFEGNKELRRFGEEWFQVLQWLLDEGRIRTHPLNVSTGGLAGVLDGLERVKAGKVAGEKLVYSLT